MEEAVVKSDLPTKPNFDKVEKLLMELTEEALWKRR